MALTKLGKQQARHAARRHLKLDKKRYGQFLGSLQTKEFKDWTTFAGAKASKWTMLKARVFGQRFEVRDLPGRMSVIGYRWRDRVYLWDVRHHG